jgi:SAM-dependent methyltransferase
MSAPSAPLQAMSALHGRAVFGRRVRVLAGIIAPLLPPGRLLDVGCGSGTIARALAELRPDVSPEGFDVFVRKETEIPVAPFDGRRLPVPDDAAAAATLVDVLHHAEDPVALLADCARVAPVVVVKDHLSKGAWDERVLSFMDWVGNRPHGVVLPFHFFTPESWRAALRAAGLREVSNGSVPGLYPFPFSLAFGGHRQFVARLERS